MCASLLISSAGRFLFALRFEASLATETGLETEQNQIQINMDELQDFEEGKTLQLLSTGRE